MSEYDDYVSGRVDARYHNYMANKPGDEAEQNPVPENTRGHWCDFCQTFHSSQSCYHPGWQMLRMAESSVNVLQAQRDAAQEERDELKLKNDVATDNIRLYCDEIRDLKAKLAAAEQQVRELKSVVSRIDAIVSDVPRTGDPDSAVMDVMRVVSESDRLTAPEPKEEK